MEIFASIAVVVILLAIMAGAAMLMLGRLKEELGKMSPVDTRKVRDGLYAVRDGYVNMYMVECEGGFIAIDSGHKSSAVKGELEKLSIDPGSVKAVLLTHVDPDHVGAVGLFRSAGVYVPSPEEAMMDGSTNRIAFIKNMSLKCAYTTLKDGQRLEIGGVDVQCISTPGHTPGHSAYLVKDEYLFSGDALSLQGGHAEIFNKQLTMDVEMGRKSIRKLAGLTGVSHIFTAHYGYSDSFERAMEGWMR
jgi:glyoxylase-like metal-dependent hydrolase (beta-lactamase superfamily II)